MLYRTPRQWRYAIYGQFGGIMTQADLGAQANEVAGRELQLDWTLRKTDWGTAEVQ